MSNEDLESSETVEETEDLYLSTEDETGASDSANSSDDSTDDVTGNTNDSINASLDKIKDPDVLKGMVTRLRHENGNHRRAKKELEKENETLKNWKRNHLKGVQEAEARAVKAEAVAKQHVIKAAALEYGVDDDLIDLIDGSSEDEIWEKASRLADTKREKRVYETPTDTNLFGGRTRGAPVRPPAKSAGSDFFEDLIGRGPAPRRSR